MSAPESYDLTAAAQIVLHHTGESCDTGAQGAESALRAVWEALTGLEGTAALEHAQALAWDTPPTTAYVPPC